MNNGPKLKEKSIWDGILMPSILRGSKAHNERVLAEREIARKAAATEQVKKEAKAKASKEVAHAEVPAKLTSSALMSFNNKEFANLFQRAQDLASGLVELSSLEPAIEAETFKVPTAPTKTPLYSRLYSDEQLDSSPLSSPTKKRASTEPVLSPFSKAKRLARASGVNLGEDCRDVYTESELMERIAFLAEVTKRQRLTMK